MKLINTMGKGAVALLLFFILLIGTSLPISATVVFEEDFSDNPAASVEFLGGNHTLESTEGFSLIPHTYEISNGELISAGENKFAVFNWCIINQTNNFGTWSFDWYYTGNDPIGIGIFLMDDFRQWDKPTDQMNHSNVYIWIYLDSEPEADEDSDGTVEYYYDNKRFNMAYDYIRNDSITLVNNIQYKLELTVSENKVDFEIDGTSYISQPLSSYHDFNFNYLAIREKPGSMNRIDNIKIMDLNGEEPSQTNTSAAESSSDNGDLNWQLITFGGAFGLITVIYVWSKGKKNF